MRNKYLILLMIFVFAGCIDPDTPGQVRDASDASRDVQGDVRVDGAGGLDAVPQPDAIVLDSRADAGVQTDTNVPVLQTNAPADSIYCRLVSMEGSHITVQVRANDIQSVGLLSFRLKYDPTVLKITGLKVQSLFGQKDKKGVFVARDMHDGTISFGGAYYGMRYAIDFKDTLIATIDFDVLQPRTAQLSFPAGYILVIGKDRKPVPVDFLNSTLSFGISNSE